MFKKYASVSLSRSSTAVHMKSSKSVSESSAKEQWLEEKRKQHQSFQDERKKLKIQENRVLGRKSDDILEF